MAQDFDRIDYVLWATRSLNRIMGLQMTCTGHEIGPWRGALGDFKTENDIVEPNLDKFQIGAATQDLMIRLNDQNEDYVAWLRRHLPVSALPEAAGFVDKLRAGIRTFQGKHGLKQDGWVGPRTEAEMARLWPEPVPGEYKHSRNPRPNRPPIPDWLKSWRRLPPSQRYIRWMEEVADKIGASAGLDPGYKQLAGIMARNAAEDPRRVDCYFGSIAIDRVCNSVESEIMTPAITKLPDGRFSLPPATLRAFRLTMSDTRALPMLCFKPVATPEAYAALHAEFELAMLNLFKSMHGGINAWNFRWNWAGQILHDRLFVVRGIIESLMRDENHAYHAYATMKSAKLDDMPGAMRIMFPWRWFDDARW